ncbi:hypothetical protein HHI36_002449 [Cryptolaemus montrouzieri]|uniref:Uncharacterized protein n=1 Tax=Cryptolaemus montrouzieri TaxID=559131 RepID=A0ABD2PB62_9CUCU
MTVKHWANSGSKLSMRRSGERLIDFCELYSLQILNGFFQHEMIHRYTRERPSLGQRSIIDYVIKRQLSKLKINDCKVKRGTNCRSDHRLITTEKHQTSIREKALAEAPPSEHIEEEYSNMKLAVKRVAHKALGYEQKRKIQKAPNWLTDEVKQTIDEKTQCYHRWLSDKTNVK